MTMLNPEQQIPGSSSRRTTFLYGIGPEVHDYYFQRSRDLPSLVGLNSGNLLFTKAIALHAELDKIYSWNTNLDNIDNEFTKCIIPCANFLGPHADMAWLLTRMQGYHGEFVGIGLGAQANNQDEIPIVPDGTVQWLQRIVRSRQSDHPNISLRGPFTHQVLDRLGLADSACVTGCPSNFISSDPLLGKTISRKLNNLFARVGVASAHYRWTYLAKAEQDLFKLVRESDGIYVMQSPDEMILAGTIYHEQIPDEIIESIRLMCAPELSLPEVVEYIKKYFRTYFNISEWMSEMARCSLVIGARIHGVMAGLQAGVPSLCIAHDSRTAELCEVMHIPHLTRADVSKGINKTQIEEALAINWDNYDKRRAELLGIYYDFLVNNNIAPTNHLINLKAKIEPSYARL